MDYYAIHGHDIASFDTGGTHRLPTVAASQALDDLDHDGNSYISTGIEHLDKALLDSASVGSQGEPRGGGIKRGQVTEIWGPPGTGKTALGMQLAANALSNGNSAVWVDCFQNLNIQRFSRVLNHVRSSRKSSENEAHDIDAGKFSHYCCLTLPHLMALISRPTTTSIPTDTSLIIISSMSALLNAALPKSHEWNAGPKASKGPTPSAKRLQGLQSIITGLQKLAAIRNCAVVVLSQCATRMQAQQGPTLIPAVNATVWEQGVSSRVALFRDWAWQGKKLTSLFLAGLQKLEGKATDNAVDFVSAFKIGDDGVFSVHYDMNQSSISIEDTAGRPKRKLGQTELEVPDSEDDEAYGWADEDEASMPAPPPQWQGSEDIILGQEVGHSEDEAEATEDEARSDEYDSSDERG